MSFPVAFVSYCSLHHFPLSWLQGWFFSCQKACRLRSPAGLERRMIRLMLSFSSTRQQKNTLPTRVYIFALYTIQAARNKRRTGNTNRTFLLSCMCTLPIF